MKRLLILMMAAAVCSNAFGQRRLKYKDIFDQMGKEPQEHSVLKLAEFQKVNPEFANTYLQVGVIQWGWLREQDPFLDYAYVKELIYNTKLYLGLAKSKVMADDKEVKKNKVYYSNINITPNPETLDQQDVIDYINKLLAKVDEYDKNVSKIITNYNQAVGKYDGCIDTYKMIVARQSNYKNLLLTNTPDLRAQLKDLSQNFDSVKYYFDEFKSALGSYPIKDYDQKTKVVPIETYRLEGLTPSDFLKPVINIWDFNSWVAEAFSKMDGDIVKLKGDAEREIKSIRARVLDFQKQKAETDTVMEISASNKTVNLIEKYDFESLLSAALRYEAAKANFQVTSMHSANKFDNQASRNEDLGQKANYYYDLMLMAENAKQWLDIFGSRINDNNILKHQEGVNSLYGGKQKLQGQHIQQEKAVLAKLESDNLANFQKFVVDQLNPENQEIAYSGKKIPTQPSDANFALAAAGSYKTLYTIKDGNGHRYVCGYLKTSATASSGFVAMLKPDGTVAWLTQLNGAATGSNKVVQVIPSKFAGAVAVVANTNGENVKTSVFYLDANGKASNKTDLTSSHYPAAACYDEIADAVTVVTKGKIGNEERVEADLCDVETVVLGQKQTSPCPTSFWLKGQVVDIIKGEDGYIVVCNYRELKIDDVLNTSNSNIAAVVATMQGSKANIMKADKSVRAIKAFKVNAETISLIGSQNTYDKMISTMETPLSALLSAKGEFMY